MLRETHAKEAEGIHCLQFCSEAECHLRSLLRHGLGFDPLSFMLLSRLLMLEQQDPTEF